MKLFFNSHGYASIKFQHEATAYGALWSISTRDQLSLDIYEDIESKLYKKTLVTIITNQHIYTNVLVYVSTNMNLGQPRAKHIQMIENSSRKLGLPEEYCTFLESWRSQ